MKLDSRIASLVAVGASVAANCQPCLQINTARAFKHGATREDVADAVEVGRRVRAGAASKLDAFAASLDLADGCARQAGAACGCPS